MKSICQHTNFLKRSVQACVLRITQDNLIVKPLFSII